MKTFIHDDFLLHSEMARFLYHHHASKMPIFDYHCHIPPGDIASDRQYSNLTQLWLAGDHYKWRAMRTNGVNEKYCTGNASDWEKFEKWAETVPFTLRNPLYHWTHMELKRFFGIDKLLNPETAREIWETCNEKLNTPGYSVRNLIRMANVHTICTTDDPTDSLEHHRSIRESGFEVRVLPAWRPDRAMNVEDPETFTAYVDLLAEVSDTDIRSFGDFMEALDKRHQFFHDQGCRLSDHGLETAYADDFEEGEIETIFTIVRDGGHLAPDEIRKFKSCMLYEFGIMDHRRGWVQQYHLGALRNNNTRLFKAIGPDTGFDSIGDFELARPLSKMLDKLDAENRLARTILYNLNPRDNELIATMTGNFQDGSVAGKMQFGAAWWFLDQKDGMEKQIQTLSNLGLLSRFIGMLTDSRSFLSYVRHEYFRRTLCNLLGQDVERGEIPDDPDWLGKVVENICFYNARNYLNFP